jgi:predicted Rossmann fold flavoprotein
MANITIGIIGGGAAGFFAAITCAELLPDAEIFILERGKKVLEKVRISGGGRCNVTHACFDPAELVEFYPRGKKALRGPFSQFCSGDTVAWFEDRGVALKIEEDGRMFPISNKSETIVRCLTGEAEKHGVKVHLQQRVEQIYPPERGGHQWKIMTAKGESFFVDKLLIATGSNKRVWDMIHHLGHQIIEPVPSLFTFNIKDNRIKDLPGVSVPNAHLEVLGTKLEATGPLLITHWGLSGPGILRLSAWGARQLAECQYQFELQVNWMGNLSLEDIRAQLLQRKERQAPLQISKKGQGPIPSRLWRHLISAAGIRPEQRWADLSKNQLQQLTNQLGAARFKVNGKSTFKDEFVTAGGIDLREVDFRRFESRIHRNLFFAGEVLNIDAITGGFNFQAAWTGGWISGHAMADQ